MQESGDHFHISKPLGWGCEIFFLILTNWKRTENGQKRSHVESGPPTKKIVITVPEGGFWIKMANFWILGRLVVGQKDDELASYFRNISLTY